MTNTARIVELNIVLDRDQDPEEWIIQTVCRDLTTNEVIGVGATGTDVDDAISNLQTEAASAGINFDEVP